MQKIKTFLIIVFFSIFGIVLGNWSTHAGILPISTTFRSISNSTNSLVSHVFSPAPPAKLIIPALGVNANVEPVTVDSQNHMAVPKNIYNVGWYSLGATPGQIGNAVIDGHYNTPTGAPNVFYYLNTLQSGDTIEVVDTNNQTFTYTVSEVEDYPVNQIPLEEIFGSSNQAKLILITCSGVWDRSVHNYTDRTVVFADLQR